MSESVAASVTLDSDPRNVGRARSVLREALTRSGAEHLVDSASVVLSEVVTNAFVHAGGRVRVDVAATSDWVRVEVQDGSSSVPARRNYASTAGTGRGVPLMDSMADRWGIAERPVGKAVWFEVGDGGPSSSAATGMLDGAGRGARGGSADVCLVTLRNVPVLMHAAWQEHAATLLREYLLHVLEDDDEVLQAHAYASAAMSLLHEQLPTPVLSDEPGVLMADAIEPKVSVNEVVLRIPGPAVPCFQTLDDLLRKAMAMARAGLFLSPPTQPEINEMRQWICSEIARQAAGDTTATPWLARTDVRATVADQAALKGTYSTLSEVDEPLLATDEASIIVAASPSALDLLGYGEANELLGRRVIVVVPARFHQAHIAGTTLHATNGRDNLLRVPINVPMVRADGSEIPVRIEVRSERVSQDRRVFIARFQPL